MGYFDYMDDGKATQIRDLQFMDAYAKISAWMSLGALSTFILSIILYGFLDINVFFWFSILNLVGIGIGIAGIVINSKTTKVAKAKKTTSYVGNMALALHILLLLLNTTVFVIALVVAIV